MKITKIKSFLSGSVYALVAVMTMVAYLPTTTSAAAVTLRKVTIGNSAASATTTYVFNFTVPTTGTAIKSASFTACTTASGACTPAPGFSASGSSLTGQPTNLGAASGWTVNTATANSLRLLNAGNSTNPSGAQTVSFSGVVNPSATNSTFYLRIATFSGSDWSTGPLDSGVVASSTAGVVTVTATVDETLTFTLGTTSVGLGTITSVTTGSGTSTMTVGTNASTGYSVNYAPATTLTAGSDTITALAAKTTSNQGQKQFGINLVSNATPSVGANISGSGSGVVASNYNTTNQFMFNTAGDTVATAAAPTNNNVYTVSYIANVTTDTAAGAYSTAINYIATANF